MSGIYRIELGNGWFYIGSAVNFSKRERAHCYDLKHKVHRNSIVQRCWNKYGVFKFTILEECEIKNLLLREQIYLDKHFVDPKNVNICPTAGSNFGRVFSTEHRAKIGAANKGRIHSLETKAKISASNKGKASTKGIPLSAEHRAKIGAGNKGKIVSAKTRAKISNALKGMTATKGIPKSAEHRAKLSAATKGRVFSAEHHAKIVATKARNKLEKDSSLW